MDTRNLTVVIKDGEVRVAQYGQWDGYPEGQGMTIVEFLLGHRNVEFLRERLDHVRFAQKDEDLTEYSKLHGDSRDLPKEFDRDTAGGILQHIIDSNYDMLLPNAIKFAADSLFCEWAYVVDLDLNALEVYKGFGQASVGERFYDMQEEKGIYETHGTEYGAVRHVLTIPFKDLNTKTFTADIQKVLHPNGEEE